MHGTAGNGLIRVMRGRELLVTYRALLPVLDFHFASCVALKLMFQSYKPDPGRLTTLTVSSSWENTKEFVCPVCCFCS